MTTKSQKSSITPALIIAWISGGCLLLFATFCSVFYFSISYSAAAVSRNQSNYLFLFSFTIILTYSIPLVLLILLVFMTAVFIIQFFERRGKSKLLTRILSYVLPITLSLVISLSAFGIGSFTRYLSTIWTKEKWDNADGEYRGHLIESFEKQYNLIGYDEEQVYELLGEPDYKNKWCYYDKYGRPSEIQGNQWEYWIGHRYDYMDGATYDVRFNHDNIVVICQISPH